MSTVPRIPTGQLLTVHHLVIRGDQLLTVHLLQVGGAALADRLQSGPRQGDQAVRLLSADLHHQVVAAPAQFHLAAAAARQAVEEARLQAQEDQAGDREIIIIGN